MKKYKFVLLSHTYKTLENQSSLQINYAEKSWVTSREFTSKYLFCAEQSGWTSQLQAPAEGHDDERVWN